MAPKKSHNQFVLEMKQINPNIDILEEYRSTHTKALFKCLNPSCGHEWITTPHQILDGVGCPACRPRRRRTHQMFVDELRKVNPTVEITSKFKNFQTKVDCLCLVDGHIWSALPQALLLGHGCRKCSDKRCSEISTMSHDEFADRVHKTSPHIVLLTRYTGSANPVKCKCNIDGYEWETVANNLLAGKGCPSCGNRSKAQFHRKPHSLFCEQLKSVNPDIEALEEYKGAHEWIRCRCKIDNTIFYGIPANLLKGAQCPVCRSSKGEKQISDLLDEYNIVYDPQHRFADCKNKRTLPFDFYLPEYNTCIEFDGAQHYRPVNFGGCSDEKAMQSFNQTQRNDEIKTAYCKANGINLIRIAYNDTDNLDHILQKIKNS